MKFHPRRDIWLALTIWLCIIALVFAGLSPLLVGGTGIIGGLTIFLVCFAIAGFMAWLWLGTNYELKEDELFIRYGPFKTVVFYNSIKEAKSIRSWLASAATSTNRVEIKHGKYEVIHVSPLNKDKFLLELKHRSPHAIIETSTF